MDQHEILLKLDNIEKRFPGVVALKSISLDVRAGEVQVLLGENGAGKSTLMKILAGEHAPTAGDIEIGGKRVSALTPTLATELGIGLVHQELSLIPALSVTENIFLGRLPRNAFGKISWSKAHEAARHALEALGVAIDPTAEVRRLEVAEQQLIEITRVLARGPRILLLDEPTSALSDSERSRLFDVIRRLKQRGHGIIYISHHLSEIPMIADRVTVLRDGIVVDTLPAEQADEETVIGLMVGRRLEEQFPKEAVALGAPVLAVENLASGGTLKDLSFSLRRGEILGIYGLMGAGQAEIAGALFGLQTVKAGSIEVEGKRADFRHSSDAIAAGLGLISRDRRQSLVPMQPVGPNLSLSWLAGKSLLSRLDLGREREEGKRYISDLRIRPASTTHKLFFFSGGNQQKVILARWMSSGARILIFDEPTRGIDVGAKAEVFSVMSRLVSEGASILMISSELNELIGMADRVLVMRGGRLSAELPRDEITQQNMLRYAS
ncbi:sugar ABC transporter ATP-binding protein [Shinella sp.]|uniref:sugar ABC transporter ATP-binding protein n=1 Tax=Shinella sp. TaxID=1870904 RepID=UPI0029A43122|nr:sugar ABC transporter ATP-binding protein [Shinella sp.]MDX3974726.1 sugar ABC transporter ATP-binding protein [Shinella sp.]